VLKKVLDEAVSQMREKTENAAAALETYLQAISDSFAYNMELTLNEFEDSMTGIYGSYERMQEVFE
jgi:hypothetical protein